MALSVAVIRRLGERIHPVTGQRIVYLACRVTAGLAYPADDELFEVAWCSLADLPTYVRAGFHGPVQQYLDAVLA